MAVMRLVVVEQTSPPPAKKARRSSGVSGTFPGGRTCLDLRSGLGERWFLQSLTSARITGKRTGERGEAESVFGWWAVSLAGKVKAAETSPLS